MKETKEEKEDSIKLFYLPLPKLPRKGKLKIEDIKASKYMIT